VVTASSGTRRSLNVPRWIVVLLTAAALLSIAVAFRRSLLPLPAEFLVTQDRLEPADLIYVLNGDPNLRPFQAARLYQEGLAPLVAIARAGDSPMVTLGLQQNTTDMCIGVLQRLGVPSSHILQLDPSGGVGSTFNEAQVLRSYVRKHSVNRVIVVTSAFHTRRAGWIIRRVLRDTPVRIMMFPVTDRKYSASNWWTREDGEIAVNDEFVKLFWYVLRYGF
jgi:uncharacterized SAM-binding protein YcdF (DUF218 family)